MLNKIGVIVNIVGVIVNAIIAFGVFRILYIANQEKISQYKGLKDLSGYITITNTLLNTKTAFIIAIRNKGFANQNITHIKDDKGNIIYLFLKPENTNQLGKIIPPGQIISFVLYIDQIKAIENSAGLFVSDIYGAQKKIISKKDIQKALDLYKKSQ